VGTGGEIALRPRQGAAGAVEELIVNGAFAMDSAEVSSERALAAVVGRPGARVLVGGLGLGYTALELVRLGAAQIEVVELEPCLVEWARAGMTTTLAAVAAEPAVRLRVGDIAAVLLGSATGDEADGNEPDGVEPFHGPWDGILLDVDNGPDFLIHAENARLYDRELLEAAAARLARGGILAIWCQGAAPALASTLAELAGEPGVRELAVEREGRRFVYVIYSLTRPGA
jgi:spermidine synthase